MRGPLLSITNAGNGKSLIYTPASPKHWVFHESPLENFAALGARGTGKSHTLRMDAHARALTWPGLKYAILRRTVPQIRKNHIAFLYHEADVIGAQWSVTTAELRYPNGSIGYFFSCDDETALENVLGAEFGVLYIDEAPTFPWSWITRLTASARVPVGSKYKALVRLSGNPIGVSAQEIYSFYIAKDVRPEDDPDYDPSEYGAVELRMKDNPHLPADVYRRRFAGQPKHIRDAWLDGEWTFGGLYFSEIHPDRHFVDSLPPLTAGKDNIAPLIYRAMDWGWNPDPAICLWIAVYPNGRAIVFKERHWHQTTAEAVARDIRADTGTMPIRGTFCDPSMFGNDKALGNSIGRTIEQAGVPLIASKNDRELAGMAIHEWLGQTLEDGKPKLQIYAQGCPELVRTIQKLPMDKHNPRKIGNGPDHWTIALGYFCMGDVRAPLTKNTMDLLQGNPRASRIPNTTTRRLGAESVRIVGW